MARDHESDEVVADVRDASKFTEMEDGFNDTKMEVFENSTKNGHLTEVR